MKNIYYFAFYSIYCVIKKTPNKDIAEWVAAILLALLIVFNICCAFFYLNILNSTIYKEYGIEILIILFFSIFIINVFLFLNKGRFKLIIKEFSLLKKSLKLWRGIGVLLYAIFSVALIVHVVNVM
jgi:hypothetical protein